MLVLTRAIGESVIILCEGRTIKVELGQTKGKQASLRFEADKSVKIYREELLDRMRGVDNE